MNDTDVHATNTDYKTKLHKHYKLVLQIWLVNNNVVPLLIQEHVTLGKTRLCVSLCISAGVFKDSFWRLPLYSSRWRRVAIFMSEPLALSFQWSEKSWFVQQRNPIYCSAVPFVGSSNRHGKCLYLKCNSFLDITFRNCCSIRSNRPNVSDNSDLGYFPLQPENNLWNGAILMLTDTCNVLMLLN